jgi:hypothetical protein
MKDLIEKQKKVLSNQIKKHIDVFQNEIDKMTSKIFLILKPELEIIKNNNSGINIILFPTIEFKANDIAPEFSVEINYFWYLFILEKNGKVNTFKNHLTPTMQNIIDSLKKENNFIIETNKISKKHINIIKNYIK